MRLAQTSKPRPKQPRLLWVAASHNTLTSWALLRRIAPRHRAHVYHADTRGTTYTLERKGWLR